MATIDFSGEGRVVVDEVVNGVLSCGFDPNKPGHSEVGALVDERLTIEEILNAFSMVHMRRLMDLRVQFVGQSVSAEMGELIVRESNLNRELTLRARVLKEDKLLDMKSELDLVRGRLFYLLKEDLKTLVPVERQGELREALKRGATVNVLADALRLANKGVQVVLEG